MAFVIKGNKVLNDREPLLINGAGNHPRNPVLAGLGYNLIVKSTAFDESQIVSALLAVSTEIDFDVLLAPKFTLTQTAPGEFAYNGIVGDSSDPTGLAVSADPSADPLVGVVVYLSLVVRTGEGAEFTFEKKLHYREPPRNHGLFNRREYVSPYAIQIQSQDVDVEFFPEWKDDTGVKRYGGSITAEILDDPNAPSAGPFLATIPGEVALPEPSQVALASRGPGGGQEIPGYTVPPYIGVFASGTDIISSHFYFLRARYRSIAGSPTYVDLPVVLFANQDCGIKNNSGTGGFGIPPYVPPPTTNGPPTIDVPIEIVPPDDPFIPGAGPEWRIPIADPIGAAVSGTYFSPVAAERKVLIYEFDPLFPAAEAPGYYEDQDTIRVSESDFVPPLDSLPFLGGYFVRVEEYAPDRTPSNGIFPAPFEGLLP